MSSSSSSSQPLTTQTAFDTYAPPVPFLLAFAAATAYRARSVYIRPLDDIVRKTLQKYGPINENDIAKRALGFAVARRALGVATNASLAMFSTSGAILYKYNNCSTWYEGIVVTRAFGVTMRRRMDDITGNTTRVDETSAEYKYVQSLTPAQEMEYYKQQYFGDEIYKEQDKKQTSAEKEAVIQKQQDIANNPTVNLTLWSKNNDSKSDDEAADITKDDGRDA